MDKPKKSLLSIHKDRLDEDCAGQPKLMYEWGLALAEAKERTETAKKRVKAMEQEMKAADACLELEVRSGPTNFGLEKATDKSVEAVVASHARHKEAYRLFIIEPNEELIACLRDEWDLEALIKALVDRKQELENMVYLHGQLYWSKPAISGERRQKDSERMARKVTEEGRRVNRE